MNNVRNLYVTDWNTNGTNDLLICNESQEVISVIHEATFGIDVTKGTGQAMLYGGEFVGAPLQADEAFNPEYHIHVKRIDQATLLKCLAASPIDPQSSGIGRELRRAGIQLSDMPYATTTERTE